MDVPPGWLPEPMLAGTELEYSICVPPPLPESCLDGTMPVLGETECQPMGDPCPAGDWPEGLPPGATVVYVEAGATGGNGSSTISPFGSIGAAVTAAPPGAVVAIAKGTYPEAVTVAKELTLWGACVAGVTIEGPAGGLTDATLEVVPPGSAAVRNVTVTGPRFGVVVLGGAELQGAGIRVQGARGKGIAVLGGGVDLHDVAVMNTNAWTDGIYGRGLDIQQGGQATVERATFDQNREFGVVALDLDSHVQLTAVVVRGTQSRLADKEAGRGLSVEEGARAVVERGLFDRNRELGILAKGAGSEVTLMDVVVNDTRSREIDQSYGSGIQVEEGARVTGERTLVDANRSFGIGALNDATDLTLRDVVVRNTSSQESDQLKGRGLEATLGATVTVERALFEHNRGAGAVVDRVLLSMTDVVVKDTQSQEQDLQHGFGLVVQGGASATVQRALFDHNRGVGIYALLAGTELALVDVVVKDTLSQESDLLFGFGLGVRDSAHATVDRGLFDRNRQFGIGASDPGTQLLLTHAIIKDTQAREYGLEYGVGVGSSTGAFVDIRSSRISGNRVAGILGFSGGGLTISSSEVVATQAGSITLLGPDGLTASGPHYDDIGDGILVVGGSSAALSDVLVADCARTGVLFSDSSGSLASVTSTANRYGLAMQGSPKPSYDAGTCDFSGNTELPILTDGNLPVPNAPLDVPEAP